MTGSDKLELDHMAHKSASPSLISLKLSFIKKF